MSTNSSSVSRPSKPAMADLGAIQPFRSQRSMQAARAAEAAGRQGRFREMHDRLFQHPTTLDDEIAHAEQLEVQNVPGDQLVSRLPGQGEPAA